MARKIRFPLHMGDGTDVRTIEELQEHFDIESVLGYFTDGKLKTWLEDRYYDEQARAVSELSADMPDLSKRIFDIFDIKTENTKEINIDDVQRRKDKLKKISAFTANKEILDNIDVIAMDQMELLSLIEKTISTIYLFGREFEIPKLNKAICFIGLNNPTVNLADGTSVLDYSSAGISFKDVTYGITNNPYFTSGEQYYIEGKYDIAFPLIKEAAENGNPRAMYIVAMCYRDGFGIGIDKAMCNEWLKRAYGMDEPLSSINYAYVCCKDDLEKKNKILSEHSAVLELLASIGDVLAQFEYGNYLLNYGKKTDKEIAILYISKSAEQGLAEAQNAFGDCYYDGNGIGQNYGEAVRWYTKAAEQGLPSAQKNLGVCYQMGKGIEKDRIKAVEWYTKAAERGLASAQQRLGVCYKNGWGVDKNSSMAMEWYIKAIEQGLFSAYYGLGDVYKGKGDYTKAVECYTKAAEHGDVDAQKKLGNIYGYGDEGIDKDYTKAIEWFTKAAEQGDAAAQFLLAMFYETNDMEKNITNAAKWYTKAAEQGDAYSQYRLGVIYEKGKSVGRDYNIAVEWYTKAAEQGIDDALNALGYCYERGNGVHQSYTKAVEWYTKAAERGNSNAQNNLGNCYYNGTGVEQEYTKAVEWYTKAVEHSNAAARNNLGKCYLNGNGVSINYKKAFDLFYLSAADEYPKAFYNMGYCYEYGYGVKKDLNEAIYYYSMAAKYDVPAAIEAKNRVLKKF